MIDDILFRRRLRKLRKENELSESNLFKKVKEAEKNNMELYYELLSDLSSEREVNDDKIKTIIHQYIYEQAEKYLIPIPEYNEKSPDWEKSKIFSSKVRLTEAALARINAEIKKSKKDIYNNILLFVTAMTGLIGALTGLFAMLC